MSNRPEIRGSAAGSSSSNTGAVPKVRLMQTSIISHVLSLKFLIFFQMVITKVRDCVGGQVSITVYSSYFPLTHISLCAAGLVSRAPRVSPVLLLSAPGIRVNLHKVRQGGHWNKTNYFRL